MLNQSAVEIPTLPVDQCQSHLIQFLEENSSVPSRKEGPPSIKDTHGISGNVLANPVASSSTPYPQGLNQWNSSTEEPLHSSTVEKSEKPEQNQDLRCQSGPSAKNQSSSMEETLQIIMGQIDNDSIFQMFISINSPRQHQSLVGRNSILRYVHVHNFLRKLCSGSKKWRLLRH